MTAAVETVRERPILFSGPMVRAILEGRKVQMRRVIKPQPEGAHCCVLTSKGEALFFRGTTPESPSCDGAIPKCPYGIPGTRLWVRETWQALTRAHGFEWENLYGDMTLEAIERDWLLYYRATDSSVLPEDSHWRPSIFMPRWASRITLEITGVRVERLNSITEEDAEAEGLYHSQDHISDLFGYEPGKYTNRTALGAFGRLWESINGKKYPWASNPFVWVVEFKRV